jgi:hypothetical protein
MKAAERAGMTWEEYGQWIILGLWNLDGDPDTSSTVTAFRELFGNNGWKGAAAGITVAEATRRAHTDGAASVIEAAEVMTALTELGGGFNEPDDEPQSFAPQKSDPIDFN